MNSHYGPFLSWQVDKQTVIGLGHSEDSGRWKYRFEMMSRTGETRKLLSSPDPTVDDEGDPTGNQP